MPLRQSTGCERLAKYLLIYPLNVLSIAKAFILLSNVLSVIWWWTSRELVSTLAPILHVVSVGILLIALWFTIQKFYFRVIDFIFNLSGLALSLYLAILAIEDSSKLSSVALFDILTCSLLTSIAWGFCAVWSLCYTGDAVSTLFVPDYDDGISEMHVEIVDDRY